MMKDLAIGIDIGGTNTKIGIISSSKASVLGHLSFPTESYKDFSDFLSRIESSILDLLNKNSLGLNQIQGIGIGAPNANALSGKIENAHNLAWNTVAIVDDLQKKMGLPVRIGNDADLAALAEGLWGNAKNLKDYIVVTLGTGVGTGIVTGGRLLLGPSGPAGEGGHIVVDSSPMARICPCGGKGHLEAYASGPAIEKTSEEIFKRKVTNEELCTLFENGDANAKKVFQISASYLGKGLSLMASLFVPKVFVLSGGVSQLGEAFACMTEEVMNELVFQTFRGQTKIVPSKISPKEGAILGAASLIFTFEKG